MRYYDTAPKRLGKVKLRSNTIGISNCAFSHQWYLNEVNLNDGLRYIGDEAFYGCDFKKIVIPDIIKYIGTSALGWVTADSEIFSGYTAKKNKDIYIYCKSGSTAKKYAAENGFHSKHPFFYYVSYYCIKKVLKRHYYF